MQVCRYCDPFIMILQLDVWLFMQRLARGCNTESHPLYGPFMSHLSVAIFEWDSRDTLGKSKVMQLFYSWFMTLQSSH